MAQLSLEEQIKQLQETLNTMQLQVAKEKIKGVKKTKTKREYSQEYYKTVIKPKRQEEAKLKITERICPICHTKFTAKGNKKYCCEECKRQGILLTLRRNADKPENKAKVMAITKLQRKLLPMKLIRQIAKGEIQIEKLKELWNIEEIKNYLIENNLYNLTRNEK